MVGKPLTPRQVRRVARAVDAAERWCGLQLLVFIGDVEDDPREAAERLLAESGAATRPAVLVLVAPPRRRFEIVTDASAHERLPDEVCRRVAAHMSASFAVGDVTGGVCEGLRLLAQHAGPGEEGGHEGELPDVLLGHPH